MKTDDLTFWLSWCIEEYAAAKNIASTEIADTFEKKGVLSYLADNAEILHTQGKNYILDSIDNYMKNHPTSIL